MTGATEAVTPEQRAENLYFLLDDNISTEKAMAAIAGVIREAEANALRRAADLADNYCGGNHTAKDHVLAEDIASAIGSLLPKEEGQAPDAPR